MIVAKITPFSPNNLHFDAFIVTKSLQNSTISDSVTVICEGNKMKSWTYVLFTSLSLLVSVTSHAGSVCQSLCTSEKKTCTREADQDAKAVVDPLIQSKPEYYPSKNPNQLPQTPTQETRLQRNEVYRKSLAENVRQCDVQESQCLAACSKSAGTTDKDSDKSIEKYLENKKLPAIQKEK
jgi:hypothetical protein